MLIAPEANSMTQILDDVIQMYMGHVSSPWRKPNLLLPSALQRKCNTIFEDMLRFCSFCHKFAHKTFQTKIKMSEN